jgi:hypothetical protein
MRYRRRVWRRYVTALFVIGVLLWRWAATCPEPKPAAAVRQVPKKVVATFVLTTASSVVRRTRFRRLHYEDRLNNVRWIYGTPWPDLHLRSSLQLGDQRVFEGHWTIWHEIAGWAVPGWFLVLEDDAGLSADYDYTRCPEEPIPAGVYMIHLYRAGQLCWRPVSSMYAHALSGDGCVNHGTVGYFIKTDGAKELLRRKDIRKSGIALDHALMRLAVQEQRIIFSRTVKVTHPLGVNDAITSIRLSRDQHGRR